MDKKMKSANGGRSLASPPFAFKKIIASLLCVCLLIGLLPVGVLADAPEVKGVNLEEITGLNYTCPTYLAKLDEGSSSISVTVPQNGYVRVRGQFVRSYISSSEGLTWYTDATLAFLLLEIDAELGTVLESGSSEKALEAYFQSECGEESDYATIDDWLGNDYLIGDSAKYEDAEFENIEAFMDNNHGSDASEWYQVYVAGGSIPLNSFDKLGKSMQTAVGASYAWKANADYWLLEIHNPEELAIGEFLESGESSEASAVILVQVGGEVSLDYTALNAAITAAEAKNQSDYYTSGDRYNGKDTSVNGFWADMQAALTAAKAINGNAASQDAVDAATKRLATATGKLIPSTQVNPTALYETYNAFQKTDTGYKTLRNSAGITAGMTYDQSNYAVFRWNAFTGALQAAEDTLSALYEQDGSPSGRNWGPARDGEKPYDAITNEDVTASVEAIVNALNGMVNNDQLDAIEANRSDITKLLEIFDIAERGNYTEASWSSFTAAKSGAQDLLVKYPTRESIDRTIVMDNFGSFSIVRNALYDACYGLTESGSITIHVTVSDNLGAVYPEYALKNAATATFDGEVTLADGAHSLKALRQNAAFNWDGETVPSNQEQVSSLMLVYVNGKIITGSNYFGTVDSNSEALNFRDGDQVLLVRVVAPVGSYYGWDSNPDFNDMKGYLGTMTFTTDTEKLTPKEGESFGVNVTMTMGNFSDYTGRAQATVGKQIIAYGPYDEETGYPATPILTGAFTDDAGTAQVTLYAAGKYLLVPVDTAAMVKGSKYPNLTGGYHAEVTVGALSESNLNAAIQAQKDELERIWATCDEAVMAGYKRDEHQNPVTPYADCKAAYDTAKAVLESATTLQEARDAVSAAKAIIEPLVVKADEANEQAVLSYSFLLGYLPSVEEICEGKFVTGHLAAFEKAMAWRYAEMTPYQLENMLTVAQIEHWDTLFEAYTKHLSGEVPLPEVANYTVTLEYVGISKNEMSNPPVLWDYGFFFLNGPETVTPGYGKQYYLRTLDGTHVDEQEDWELYDVQVEGDVSDAWFTPTPFTNPQNSLSGQYWISYYVGFSHASSDVTIKLYLRSRTGDLEGVRSTATSELTKAYQGYSKSNYSAANWQTLTTAYNSGLSEIQAATDADAIATAKSSAISAMAAVATIQSGMTSETVGTYGTVHVVMENTVRSDLPFYGKAGILECDMPLDIDSTMMTVVLKALQKSGYDWTGTGGSSGNRNDFTITYLSTISKSGQMIGEFSGSAGSGWMGTLNDWFVNEGFQSFRVDVADRNYRLADGDEIRIMFTDNLGVDLGGGWGGNDTSLKSLTVSGGTMTPTFSAGTTSYVLQLGSGDLSFSYVAANKNFQVRTYLNEKSGDNWFRSGEAVPAKVGDTINIGIGGQGWPSLNSNPGYEVEFSETWYTIKVTDANSADTVVSMIKALTTITYSNYKEQMSSVELARGAYDALNSDAKAKVTNLTKLTDAEAAIKKFKAIDNVKEFLAAIPAADKLTTSDKSKVQAAKTAYDKLTDEQKQYITVGDVAKYNAAVEWLEKQGVSTGGQITGSDKAPDDVVTSTEGTTVEVTPEATVTDGEAKAEVSSETITSALTEAAKDDTTTAIVIAPEITGDADKVTVEIPKTAVSNVANSSDLAVTVSSDVADITITNEGLTELAKETGSTVTVSAENTDAGVKIEVAVGDKVINEVAGGLTVGVPATEDGNVLVIVDAEGNETVIKKSVVDEETMKAIVDGSCTVKVVDNSKDFTDVADTAWYAGDVDFASSHELFQGVSTTEFAPETEMTRAMLATVLFRLEEAAATGSNAFTDVPANAYYTDAVTWANGAGIVQGYGSSFGSEDNITRQDLATMLYRYAKTVGMDTGVRGDMSSFNDTESVSDYADEAVRWAVGSGIIGGKGNGVLDPKGNATRAEVAAMLQRLVKLMVK